MSGQSPNVAKLQSEFAGDPEMAELVEMFVSELPERIQTLNTIWTGKQFDELKRMSHQLKGASAGYGYPVIGTAAGQLEASLKTLSGEPNGEALNKIKKQFDDLVTLCRRAAA